MAKGWHDVQSAVDRARKLALPWSTEKGYHVKKETKQTRIVATFERKNPLGEVLASVEETTTVRVQLSAEDVKRGKGDDVASTMYWLTMGKKAPVLAETLADAMSTADAELEVADYEVIGRVVWQE